MQHVIQVAELVGYGCGVEFIGEPLAIGVVAVLVLPGGKFDAALPASVAAALHGRGRWVPIIKSARQVNRPFNRLVEAELDGAKVVSRCSSHDVHSPKETMIV